MTSPASLIEAVGRWQPIAYWIFRGLVYVATFALGAAAVWYGDSPPDWLPKAGAVSGFFAGQLALVNLSKPKATR